ncbi:MAG: hypothetical protein GQF41_1645 [Candidatus Rifleibacterium amylolyticum]|nr:MAG: hypothetical protein GQF41_1645 [Candidatus Rifleibacterium amylolyticum]
MSALLTIGTTGRKSGQPLSQRARRLVGRFLLCTAFSAVAGIPAEAGALDWLIQSSSARNSRKTESVGQGGSQAESVQLQMPAQEQQQLTGGNLDTFTFASSHWKQSRERLEKACRAISSRYNDNSARDILQKLFVIATQIFRENIRNTAMAVGEVRDVNLKVRQGLVAVNRIVTAPGQETLDNLDRAIDEVLSANVNQLLYVKKYLVASERTAQLARTSYETLELIPSLSLPALDMMVLMAKQLMRVSQSNSEAFKGLLLNVQSSSEQVSAGLDNVKKIVRETLRFSDHFAVKQFPLINLPTPSREKIYVQLNTLDNFVRGVDNTVQIGDSQVRNASQQFTHMITGFIAKAAESLKYQSPDNQEKALPQISNYARNQVSGLFLRAKEDLTSMRSEMAKAARPGTGAMPPAVKVESGEEMASRRARSAAGEKLPLFLLGGKNAAETDVAAAPAEERVLTARIPDQSSFLPLKTQTAAETQIARPDINFAAPPAGVTEQVLYDESASFGSSSDLMQSEVNILSNELGADFFFGSGENISQSSLQARNDDSVGFESEEEGDEEAEDNGFAESDMQISYDNLNSSGEPEIELLKFDSASYGSSSDDLIPMMRFEGETLNFED